MLRERLDQLFNKYDPVIQSLISEVLDLEQAYISMEKPHTKEQVDQIVSRLASKEIDNIASKSGSETRSMFE